MIAYKGLQRLGARWYGTSADGSATQRLPFGLYLKYHGDLEEFRNGFNALRIVRQYTSIPVPEPIDVVYKEEMLGERVVHEVYVLVTRVPGVPIRRCQDVLSDRDCERFVMQMKDYLTQLREIPKTVNPDVAICNTFGEACRDPRINGGLPVGPFVDEAAFSQRLRWPDDPRRRGHKAVFTHGDLNPRNILVSRTVQPDGGYGWAVTGIVDWDNAGYYPEYWDCTKSMFEGFRWTRRYNDLVTRVFREVGDYSQELDLETASWESGDGV